MINAKGSGLTKLAGEELQSGPVWSPDGCQIFYRGEGGSIQAVPIATGVPTILVWRGRTVEPSPDGTRIAFVTCPGAC